MNERTWLIIYVVIGWLTAIVIEIQCNRWKNKHDEAITAWTIESNNKDKQILKLQEELKNLKAEPVKELYAKIHQLGGCDASDEWSKGYDAAITEVLKLIEKTHKK